MKNFWRQLSYNIKLAVPSASNPYWRNLSLQRLVKPLISAFFITSIFGFSINLEMLDSPPFLKGLFWPIFIGAMSIGIVASRIKKPKFVPLLLLLEVATGFIVFKLIHGAAVAAIPDDLSRRVLFNVVGILISTMMGYRFLLSFLSAEGLTNVRLQTELSLAHRIQSVLVPAITFENARFEAYGRSIPSEKVGGDLVDVVEVENGLLTYVGDVAGHGLPAGQLMGMLKTAMRVALQFRLGPTSLLDSVNRVLPGVKEPHMYATMAGIFFDGSEEAEYFLAGHPPILHHCAFRHETIRLSMSQFPVGLLSGHSYQSERVRYSPGDLFLIVTDGVVEVTDNRDQEFGFERIEQILHEHASQPLPHIFELIVKQTCLHGTQSDDQTMLLIRARP